MSLRVLRTFRSFFGPRIGTKGRVEEGGFGFGLPVENYCRPGNVLGLVNLRNVMKTHDITTFKPITVAKIFMHMIEHKGQMFSDQTTNADGLYGYNCDILCKSFLRNHAINLDSLGVPLLALEDLDAPFSKRQIWNAIKDTPNNRAPGPNGYTVFLQGSMGGSQCRCREGGEHLLVAGH